jgi:hypothetical protein
VAERFPARRSRPRYGSPMAALPPPSSLPPPPPPNWGSAPAVVPFRSLRGLSVALTALYSVMIVVLLLGVGALAHRRSLLVNYFNGDNVTFDELDRADNLVALAIGLWLLLAVAVFVLSIVWLYRACRNIDAFHVSPLRVGPGWAIGAWFIPVANFILVPRLILDAWRAADPAATGNPGWQKLPRLTTVVVWWSLFAAAVVTNRIANVQGLDDAEAAKSHELWLIASHLLYIVSAVLAIGSIRAVTARQHRRADLQGEDHGDPAHS